MHTSFLIYSLNACLLIIYIANNFRVNKFWLVHINAFDHISFVYAFFFFFFLFWLSLSKSEKCWWPINASIYANSTTIFHESFIPWGRCKYVFWKVCFVCCALMTRLIYNILVLWDIWYLNFFIQNILVCLCILNYDTNVNMLSSTTFKIVSCFSFSMLLHGLTLGEKDGDLEVCDTSLYIFQVCIASQCQWNCWVEVRVHSGILIFLLVHFMTFLLTV